MQQAMNNRRTFLRAINNAVGKMKPFPCGIPSTVPRYVAIVNLCGEHLMFGSNKDTMVRKLCSKSWLMHPDRLAEQLGAFEAFLDHGCIKAQTKDGAHVPSERFVLITYSLPLFECLGNAYWEVNGINIIGQKNGPRFVCDRTCSLTSMSHSVFPGESSLTSRASGDGVTIRAGQPDEQSLEFIGPDQVKAFVDAYSIVMTDFDDDDVGSASTADTDGLSAGGPSCAAFSSPGTQAAQAKAVNAQLHSLVTVLKEGRLEDQAKIRKLETQALELKVEHNKQLQAEQEEMLAKVEEATSRAMNREQAADAAIAELKAEMDGMRSRMTSMMLEQCEKQGMYDKLSEKYEKLKRSEASKDKFHTTALNKNLGEIRRLKEKLDESSALRKQDLEDCGRAHAHELRCTTEQTQKERDTLREKLASTELMCNQLVANAENSGRELAVAQEEAEKLREQITLWREKEQRAHRDRVDAQKASDVMAKRNKALVVAERTLLAEIALLDTPPPARSKSPRERPPKPTPKPPEAIADERVYVVPVRSLGVETDTQSTATHSVAETQTSDARVLAEHLPEGSLRDKLKPPPAHAQPRAKAIVTDDDAPRASPPSPTPSTGSTQEPPAQHDAEQMSLPLPMHQPQLQPQPLPLPVLRQSPPLNPTATPFGSPAMACLQAEAAFNLLLEWMRYFGAMQLQQQGVMSPHAAGGPLPYDGGNNYGGGIGRGRTHAYRHPQHHRGSPGPGY